MYMNALPRFSFFSIYYSISKQYSTFHFSFLTSSKFLKPIAVLLQSCHCTEISCLKIKKSVMDRISGVFSFTSYLIPLRHLEIMITISLKFSTLCSVPFYDYSSNTSAGFLSFVFPSVISAHLVACTNESQSLSLPALSLEIQTHTWPLHLDH